jgi:pseudouridine kinase
MSITVIGEANIDIFVQPIGGDTSQEAARICTPSHISFHHGGVARNIAHNLRLMGHDVRLMTVFGDDDFAAHLIDDCKTIGMDLSLSTQFQEAKSPIFLSFNDATGNMQSAHSDIELNSLMDLDWLKGRIDEINRSKIVVADTLLSAEALAHLIDYCDVPLYIDSVSPKRAKRLSEAMEMSEKMEFFALKCTLSEAQALTNHSDPFKAAKALNAKGIKEVYLTLGEHGAVFSCASETIHFPALPAHVVNVTGSGDAFFAGIIHAHSLDKKGNLAVPIGLEAARLTLECIGPVNLALRR